jgi:hypothetical protein
MLLRMNAAAAPNVASWDSPACKNGEPEREKKDFSPVPASATRQMRVAASKN